jgi:energy-coupling factor transporter ATP-binding protein EcfA2
VHSSILSRKIHKLYKTSAEMLSQQPHYDFGMRAIKSVLIMAGKMKREEPDSPEDELLIKAMNGANLPKLLVQDYPLYRDLVADLFPHTTLSSPRHDDVAHVLRKILAQHNYEFSPAIGDKVVQLRGTLMVRFGVALVGASGSGKSTLINMLAECLKKLHHDNIGKYKAGDGPQPVVKDVLNPKCISIGEMYGKYNEATQEWKDGIAAFLIRNAANPPIEETHCGRWVVFDGPIDPLWVENLNTVLDDNMLLCLASGERIKLRQEMKIMFEVGDLLAASPATVSRLGVVYVRPPFRADIALPTNSFPLLQVRPRVHGGHRQHLLLVVQAEHGRLERLHGRGEHADDRQLSQTHVPDRRVPEVALHRGGAHERHWRHQHPVQHPERATEALWEHLQDAREEGPPPERRQLRRWRCDCTRRSDARGHS